jgi:hypothetical protein
VLLQKGLRDGKQDLVLEAALSINDTLDKTAFKNPAREVNTPKAVRHRAKMPMSLNAWGVHFQPLLGSSFNQGRMVTPAQEQTLWVEGEVKGEVWSHITVQPQAENNPVSIPKNLCKGYKALLAATKDDWEDGMIMCRLCLGTGFETWLHFMRQETYRA